MSVTVSTNSAFYILKRMGEALRRGPIIVGESHGSAPAREAIVYLIVNKFITKLSIEGPPAVNHMLNVQNNPAQTAQQVRDVSIGASGSLEPNDYYAFHKVVSIAQKYRVDTYFHDLPPMTGSRGNQAYTPAVTTMLQSANLSPQDMAKAQYMRKFPDRAPFMERLDIRNAFAAQFITTHVGLTPGLAILVGSDHTRMSPLQTMLNIPDGNIFILEN
jgi:hypothetical protein